MALVKSRFFCIYMCIILSNSSSVCYSPKKDSIDCLKSILHLLYCHMKFNNKKISNNNNRIQKCRPMLHWTVLCNTKKNKDHKNNKNEKHNNINSIGFGRINHDRTIDVLFFVILHTAYSVVINLFRNGVALNGMITLLSKILRP